MYGQKSIHLCQVQHDPLSVPRGTPLYQPFLPAVMSTVRENGGKGIMGGRRKQHQQTTQPKPIMLYRYIQTNSDKGPHSSLTEIQMHKRISSFIVREIGTDG